MHSSPQKLCQCTLAVLPLLTILVLVPIFPGKVSAIDGQRLEAARPPQAPLQPQQGQRERDGERDRSGAQLIYPRPSARWTLGVKVDNLPTGTRITHVSPSSAAWRVGLERRDVIVSVNGYQIGFVGRRVYDLESELNRQADHSGRVRLLVWNHRNGELVNVDTTLDRSRLPEPVPKKGGINGTVTFRSSVSAAEKAEVVVRLIDVTDRRRGGKLVVERRIAFTGKLPVPFQLDIDPTQLEPHRRYQLQANLVVNGSRVLASQPGLFPLNPNDVRAVEIELKPIRFDRR